MIARLLLLLAIAVGALAPGGAQAAKKLALVIGNNAYEGGAIDVLERAVSDARAYSKVLSEERGFDVTTLIDAGRVETLAALGAFVSRIEPGDTVMFVFSGHAMQLDPNRRDQLYLFPTDISVENYQSGMGVDLFLESYAISFATIGNRLTSSGAALRVFVLDACRNPPQVGENNTRSTALEAGIGRITSTHGEFIFYSAGPGEEALDRLDGEEPGSEGTSVFTRIFLEHFKVGTYLEDIANDVQLRVMELAATSNHVQRPYYSDGVAGRTCLDDECGRALAAPSMAGGAEIEASYWQACSVADDPAFCQAYLEEFPDGPRARLARLRIRSLGGVPDPADEGETPDDPATRDAEADSDDPVEMAIVTKRYDDGSVYEGPMRKGLQHGRGTYTTPDGYEYIGDWVDGAIEGKGRAKFANGSVYEGEFSRGAPHGTGRIVHADGGTYEGQWADGVIQGEGKAVHADGSVYVGAFRNATRHGRGVLSRDDGYRYDGDWVDGAQQGKARVNYPDGTRYEGTFANGKREGRGTITLPDGFTYTGEWKGGELTGAGQATFANGDRYVGSFRNGSRHGEGVTHYANGDRYDGAFVNGERQGKGTFTGADGYIYSGEWKEGRIEGRGKAVYTDGSVYAGDFADGDPHGEGKITYADGSTYEGGWKNGVIAGQGKARYANGSTYEGGYRNARHHGKGRIVHEDGTVYEGDWVDGKQHGEGKTIFPEGAVYEGAYANGQREGHGKLTMKDGFVYVGQWKAGEITGEGEVRYANGDTYRGALLNGSRHGYGVFTYSDGEKVEAYWKNGQIDRRL